MRNARKLTILACLFSGSSALALGVTNEPQVPGTLLSGPNAPEAGRTAVIAYHGGMLITFPEAPGSPPGDYQVRAWDISDPSMPMVTQTLGPTRHGFLAHGFIKTGDMVNSGYTFNVDSVGVVTEAPQDLDFQQLGWGHAGMSRPWGITDFWSYGDTSEPAQVFLNNNYERPADAIFDPVGVTGVIGHAFVLGTRLYYASDQSRTGIASWDITDPSNPVLLDVLTEGSVGGYWPDPVGVNGRLYFFFPRNQPDGGYQIVDATDPTDLRLVADVAVEGNPNYAQFQDEFAFTERYKIDMRTFQVVLTLDEDADNRGGVPIDTSQFSLPIGNLVVTGGLYTGGNCTVPGFGNHCGTGMSIWAHQSEPDTRGPLVGYHQPADGATGFPITHSIQILVHETLRSETINASTVRLRPVIDGIPGDQVDARYFFASNDILSIVPDANLSENTTYEVELVAGGILDAVGNGMQPYSFRFSTGSSVASGNARPEIQAFSADAQPVSPGATVGFTANASDPESDPLEYRFDFGDGNATDWQMASVASHAYNNPGHFTALVQVRDDSGAIATRGLAVSVVTMIAGLGGANSSPLAMGQNGRLWAVNPDNHTVSRFDAETQAKLDEIRTCQDPRSVAVDGLDRAWISCFDSDQLLVLGSDGRRVATIATNYGSAPFGVVYSQSNDRMLVTLYGSGELALFDAASATELDRIVVGPTPRAIAVTTDGARALATRFISGPMRGEVYDVIVTASSLTLDRTIELAHQWGIDDRFDGRGVPNYLSAIAIAPDGSAAWVTGKKDNTTRGVYLSGTGLDQDNTVRATLMKIDLVSGAEDRAQRSDLDNSEQPSALTFSEFGDYLFVALQGNNAVLVLDTLKIASGFTGASSVIGRIGAGKAPQGLFHDPSDERLWVQNFMDRTLSSFDLAGFNAGAGPMFPTTTLDKTEREFLTESVRLGKQVFYDAADPRMSGEGYISCATCHIDGGHDGRTFDFTDRGEGLRNTTTLHGRAGMGHGLVHWSANFDEIQDFEHDIRGPFGGTGFLSDSQFAAANSPLGAPKAGLNAELDALADYVASLDSQSLPRSPHRSETGAMTASALAGAAVFQSAGCETCHGGLDRTVSTGLTLNLQDVGTVGTSSGNRLAGELTGIDIPTLNGLFATAPYLHDGSAAELESVFLTTGARSVQAEDAALNGAVESRDGEHWSIAGQAVLRSGNFLAFEPGGSATLTVDGDGGGAAALRLRYHANYSDAAVTIAVNGNAQQVMLPMTLFFWRYEQWDTFDVPVDLIVGANQVEISYQSGGGFALDEIAITDTAPLINAAMPHMTFAALNATDQGNLLHYLLQLDGRPPGGMTVAVDQAAGTAFAGAVDITGTASGVTSGLVQIAIDDGPFGPASGSAGWSFAWDTTAELDGVHVVTARYVDAETGTWVETQREFVVDQAGGQSGDRVFGNGYESVTL